MQSVSFLFVLSGFSHLTGLSAFSWFKKKRGIVTRNNVQLPAVKLEINPVISRYRGRAGLRPTSYTLHYNDQAQQH